MGEFHENVANAVSVFCFNCLTFSGLNINRGDNSSMLELETRIKAVDTSSILGFDDAAVNSMIGVKEDDLIDDNDDDDEGMFAIMEDDMEDYDEFDDEPGLVGGKWDGESPFVVDTAGPSTKPTLTEEEMLTRYQRCVHEILVAAD